MNFRSRSRASEPGQCWANIGARARYLHFLSIPPIKDPRTPVRWVIACQRRPRLFVKIQPETVCILLVFSEKQAGRTEKKEMPPNLLGLLITRYELDN